MHTRTTTALLEDLRDPANEGVWREFDARYRPVLLAFGRRLGLGDEDAADAAQDALARFVRSYREGKYDRERGRLSSWLVSIARNCIIDQRKALTERRQAHSSSALAELSSPDELEELWDAECQSEIIRRALGALREGTRTDARTIQMFELMALEQVDPTDVAVRFDASLNDVYLAKHRCLKRMRPIVEALYAAYEATPPR